MWELAKLPNRRGIFRPRGRRLDLPSIPPRKISRWATKKKCKNSETGLGAVEGFSQTALTPRRTAHALVGRHDAGLEPGHEGQAGEGRGDRPPQVQGQHGVRGVVAEGARQDRDAVAVVPDLPPQ